ncbi:hypothetical protein PCE1_002657 [Barthelona sp. PCE]
MPTVKREREDDYIDVQTPFEYVLDLNHPDTTLLVALRRFMMQDESRVVTDTQILERLVSWLDSDVVIGEHEENLLWVLTNLASGTTFTDISAGKDKLISAVVEKAVLIWVHNRRVPDDSSREVFVQALWLLSNLMGDEIVQKEQMETFMRYFVEILNNIFECFVDDLENLPTVIWFLSNFFRMKKKNLCYDVYYPIAHFILQCWKRQPSLSSSSLWCISYLLDVVGSGCFGTNYSTSIKEWIKSDLLPYISVVHSYVYFAPLCRTLGNVACIEASDELLDLTLLMLSRDFKEQELRELFWLLSNMFTCPTISAYKTQIFRFMVKNTKNHSSGTVYEALFCFMNFFFEFSKDVEIFHTFLQYANDTMPLINDLQNAGKLDENDLMAIMNMHCSRVESTFVESIALVQRDPSVVLE